MVKDSAKRSVPAGLLPWTSILPFPAAFYFSRPGRIKRRWGRSAIKKSLYEPHAISDIIIFNPETTKRIIRYCRDIGYADSTATNFVMFREINAEPFEKQESWYGMICRYRSI